ncbi:hypothetical protein ONS95_011616 [Cadophora gregata]|uniref:uncharacterized protein n=1 Tax=Cadophora gregata TaxID=51156 RepID=UPI0026DCBF66|nr:uncharacterized protein ONS95_011616 [Cadophora gregata]KAK0120210.1 hypothetical protein ONS95_011616 [Cadophora gregata]KAK0121243.1 hypothetical protein ONS96_011420 [Cadophora gregata f. sp. sojae]
MVWKDEEDLEEMCANLRTRPPSPVLTCESGVLVELKAGIIASKLVGISGPPQYKSVEDLARIAYWSELRDRPDWQPSRDSSSSIFDVTPSTVGTNHSENDQSPKPNRAERKMQEMFDNLVTRPSSWSETDDGAKMMEMNAKDLSRKLQQLVSSQMVDSSDDRSSSPLQQPLSTPDSNEHISKKRKLRASKADGTTPEEGSTDKNMETSVWQPAPTKQNRPGDSFSPSGSTRKDDDIHPFY